jgi:hypothetical protein
MRLRVIVLSFLLLAVSGVNLVDANSSGKYQSASGCSCHYGGSATVSMSGQPATYTAGQTYTLSISVSGGVSGSNGGFSLEVDKGTLSTGGVGIMAVKVNAAGNSATHTTSSYRSWSVDWTAPSSGSGTTTFDLAGLTANGNNQNSGDAYGTATFTVPEGGSPPPNNPPTASNLLLTPSDPTVLTGLALSYSYNDADGDAESGTTIHWYENGILDSSKDGQMSISVVKGDDWSVEVTPSDGQDAGTMVSAGPVSVGNAAPQAQSVQLTPTSPDETSTLSASYQYSDPDQDTESGTSIVWYLDGTRVAELDDATAVSSLMTRSGDQWHFAVTPHDGDDSGSEVLSNMVVIGSSNNAPTVSSALIGPSSPATDADLDAVWTFVDTDNGDTQLDFVIEWYRDGVHVPEYDGADPLPYTATSRGEVWHYTVIVSDGIDWSSLTSSQSVTIVNTAPAVSDVRLSPETPTSSDNLDIFANYSDLDGDIESSPTIRWYRDGQLQSQFTNDMVISGSDTNRGEVWMARYTPNDGTSLGSETQSSSVTIGNSLATLSSISLAENATALSPLDLILGGLPYDEDNDQITFNIQWVRDGFHVEALDNATSIPTEWLAVGQSWSVSLELYDGFEVSPTIRSEDVVITNLMPTAQFVVGDTVLIEALTKFDASLSSDSDGDVVAWFWSIGTDSYTGEEITVILTDPNTVVNLTVIDSNGGSSSTEQIVAAAWGPVASNLDASVSDGDVNLNWDWEGDATTFTVWRTHEPIAHSSGLLEIESVGQTNTTSWSEPLHLVGNYHYTVTADVGDVHNPRISSNTVSVALEVSQMPTIEPEGDSSLGTTLTSLLAFMLIFGALATALLDRFLGRGA